MHMIGEQALEGWWEGSGKMGRMDWFKLFRPGTGATASYTLILQLSSSSQSLIILIVIIH